jgi:hypothetical protein
LSIIQASEKSQDNSERKKGRCTILGARCFFLFFVVVQKEGTRITGAAVIKIKEN